MLIEHGEIWEDRGEKGWRRVVASPEPLRDPRRAPPCTRWSRPGSSSSPTAAAASRWSASRRRAARRRGRHRQGPRRGPARRAPSTPTCWSSPPTSPSAVLRFGTPDAEPLGRVDRRRLRAHAAEGHFASGSMGPKVEAACRFVEQGGTPRGHHRPRPHPRRGRRQPPAPSSSPTRPSSPPRGTRRCPAPSRSARCRSTPSPTPRELAEAHRRRRDGRRPGRRDHRQDRGQRRRQRLHPDHRRPGVPRGAGREGRRPPSRSSRSRSCGRAAPTA